jgi:O-antigen/teichoic acid export membrane protein
MSDQEEIILDQFEETRAPRWFEHWTVVYIPIVFFIVGLIFRLQHWPYSSWLIAGGLLLMLIRSAIFFFSKKRKLNEWIYLIGRFSLFLVLINHFTSTFGSPRLLFSGLVIYGVCIIVYLVLKRKTQELPQEKLEDDY